MRLLKRPRPSHEANLLPVEIFLAKVEVGERVWLRWELVEAADVRAVEEQSATV